MFFEQSIRRKNDSDGFWKHIPIHEKGFKSSLQTDHRETIQSPSLGLHISKEIYSKMSWTKKTVYH
jgi:hypothetical protein